MCTGGTVKIKTNKKGRQLPFYSYMIKRNIKVPIYEWKCRVLVIESYDEADLAVKELKSLGVDKESIDNVRDTLELLS